MRLDEARENSHMAAQILLMNPDLVAVRGRSHPGVRLAVVSVILHDSESIHDLLAEHRPEFLRRAGPVGPVRNQEGDRAIRDVTELFQHDRQDGSIGSRASDVVADDPDGVRRFDQLVQRP